MHKPIAETAAPPAPRVPRGWRLRGPRLGIGWRLGLGLAAVTTVLVLGEMLAARTTREALAAVRSMQNEDEPLANSANAVLEKLLAYDRAVDEDMQAHGPDDFGAIIHAGDALEAAVADYFGSSPPAPVSAAGDALRLQLTRHIASARELASRAAQRAQWVAERQAALTRSTSASPPLAARDWPSTAHRWWRGARWPSARRPTTPYAARSPPAARPGGP